MFPTNKKTNSNKSARKAESSQDSAVTILTSGCHFSGKLYCRGSTRIGGKIDGDIVSEGLLIIEEEAQINANIRAEEAIIQGNVKGKMDVGCRVELSATSSFEGDVVAPVLVIHEGAQFNGKSEMRESEPALNSAKVKKTGAGSARDGRSGGAVKMTSKGDVKADPEISAQL